MPKIAGATRYPHRPELEIAESVLLQAKVEIQILDSLVGKPKTVGDIVELTGLSDGTVRGKLHRMLGVTVGRRGRKWFLLPCRSLGGRLPVFRKPVES